MVILSLIERNSIEQSFLELRFLDATIFMSYVGIEIYKILLTIYDLLKLRTQISSIDNVQKF